MTNAGVLKINGNIKTHITTMRDGFGFICLKLYFNSLAKGV